MEWAQRWEVAKGGHAWQEQWRRLGWRHRRRISKRVYLGEASDDVDDAALALGAARAYADDMAKRYRMPEALPQFYKVRPEIDLRDLTIVGMQLKNAEKANLTKLEQAQASEIG